MFALCGGSIDFGKTSWPLRRASLWSGKRGAARAITSAVYLRTVRFRQRYRDGPHHRQWRVPRDFRSFSPPPRALPVAASSAQDGFHRKEDPDCHESFELCMWYPEAGLRGCSPHSHGGNQQRSSVWILKSGSKREAISDARNKTFPAQRSPTVGAGGTRGQTPRLGSDPLFPPPLQIEPLRFSR